MCLANLTLSLPNKGIFKSTDVNDIINKLSFYGLIVSVNCSLFPGYFRINRTSLEEVINDCTILDGIREAYFYTQEYINILNENNIIFEDRLNIFTRGNIIDDLKKSGLLKEEHDETCRDGVSFMTFKKKYELTPVLCEFLELPYGTEETCEFVGKRLYELGYIVQMENNNLKYTESFREFVKYEEMKFSDQRIMNNNSFYVIRDICRKHLLSN